MIVDGFPLADRLVAGRIRHIPAIGGRQTCLIPFMPKRRRQISHPALSPTTLGRQIVLGARVDPPQPAPCPLLRPYLKLLPIGAR
jgi:hypothetical protein